MADVHSAETRSYNMSRIRSKDTKPEILLRQELFKRGFRFRLHDKRLAGTPDIVLKKYGTTIFVHGCFFHGHKNCRYFVMPKTNTEWWADKIGRNRMRDKKNIKKLKASGWNVIEVFECELKKRNLQKTTEGLARRLKKQLRKSE